MDRHPVFLGYATIERMVNALLDRVAAWQPDVIAGIARGGIVPSSMVASSLCLPLSLLSFDRQRAESRWISPAPAQGQRIVLVDDGCSSGATMRNVRDMLLGEGRTVLTFAVVHDPEAGNFVPDLSHPMRELWRFPWERGEATPLSRARRAAGEWPAATDELPFVGVDLDGIFLPDLPQKEYDADLDAALARRDALAPCLSLPNFTAERTVLITGRPERDRARTTAWLTRHGHGALPLEMRTVGTAYEPVAVARYKAETATRWGCTHFIESDPHQAVLIAVEAPHLVVTWWDGLRQAGYLVGVTASR